MNLPYPGTNPGAAVAYALIIAINAGVSALFHRDLRFANCETGTVAGTGCSFQQSPSPLTGQGKGRRRREWHTRGGRRAGRGGAVGAAGLRLKRSRRGGCCSDARSSRAAGCRRIDLVDDSTSRGGDAGKPPLTAAFKLGAWVKSDLVVIRSGFSRCLGVSSAASNCLSNRESGVPGNAAELGPRRRGSSSARHGWAPLAWVRRAGVVARGRAAAWRPETESGVPWMRA